MIVTHKDIKTYQDETSIAICTDLQSLSAISYPFTTLLLRSISEPVTLHKTNTISS